MVTKHARGGFTLVEAMLTVAIVGILFAVGAVLLKQTNRYFLTVKSRTQLQSEARSILYVITRELRQAQSVTIVIDRMSSSQPYYSRITFVKQQGTAMTFQQNGNQLQQQWDGHTEILSNNVRYLAFTLPHSDDLAVISVALTLQIPTYSGHAETVSMASEQVQVMN